MCHLAKVTLMTKVSSTFWLIKALLTLFTWNEPTPWCSARTTGSYTQKGDQCILLHNVQSVWGQPNDITRMCNTTQSMHQVVPICVYFVHITPAHHFAEIGMGCTGHAQSDCSYHLAWAFPVISKARAQWVFRALKITYHFHSVIKTVLYKSINVPIWIWKGNVSHI